MLSYRKSVLRVISLLLLAILLSVATSCVKAEPADTAALTAAATEAPAMSFNITVDYVLVRPEYAEETEVSALTLISRGLANIGVNCKVATDWVKRGAEIVPAEYEILIGGTNRKESGEAGARLSYNDYTYEVVSENVIVIRGGNPEATLEAARSFMRDTYGYEETADFTSVVSAGAAAALTVGTEYTYTCDYPVETLSIGGYDIKNFTLVSTNGNDAAAKYITSSFASLCGFNMPVVKPADFTPGSPVIYLGCADASGKHLDRIFDSYTYYITAESGVAGPQLAVDMTSATARLEAAKRFVSLYLGQIKIAETLNLPLTEGVIPGFAFGSDSNGLLLESNTETKVAEGIVYSERFYLDENELPVRAYVLTVSRGSAKFYTGTPADGEVLLNNGGTVTAEMNAAKANGKNVLAGVNADFFDIEGNYMPRGLCIKEGKLLNPHGGRPWFGVTADGTPVIGGGADYEKYAGTLYTAVGGSNIILSGSRVTDVALGSDFGKTRHPRTAVGFKDNGDVVIIVVDGRQSAISNGASLADLAKIFRELDCTDAVNLDGGGSSTFVLRNDTGSFIVENSPSGGALRKIQNSLLVLAP